MSHPESFISVPHLWHFVKSVMTPLLCDQGSHVYSSCAVHHSWACDGHCTRSYAVGPCWPDGDILTYQVQFLYQQANVRNTCVSLGLLLMQSTKLALRQIPEETKQVLLPSLRASESASIDRSWARLAEFKNCVYISNTFEEWLVSVILRRLAKNINYHVSLRQLRMFLVGIPHSGIMVSAVMQKWLRRRTAWERVVPWDIVLPSSLSDQHGVCKALSAATLFSSQAAILIVCTCQAQSPATWSILATLITLLRTWRFSQWPSLQSCVLIILPFCGTAHKECHLQKHTIHYLPCWRYTMFGLLIPCALLFCNTLHVPRLLTFLHTSHIYLQSSSNSLRDSWIVMYSPVGWESKCDCIYICKWVDLLNHDAYA